MRINAGEDGEIYKRGGATVVMEKEVKETTYVMSTY